MSRIVGLKEATNMIWETITISREQDSNTYPYFFIVGAGISTPEIPSATGIIDHCKNKLNQMYEGQAELDNIVDNAKKLDENTAKYYSYWFGTAYKNKIHRQQYLKEIISNSKISMSNLLLAQVINSKRIATTVITPNFDNHLLKSLNLMGNYEVFSTNNMMDNMAISPTSTNIQIMHIHGTYQFYDCKNLDNEIEEVAKEQGIKSTARTIEEFLKNQVPIVIGYSGWEDDVLMTKLKERLRCTDLPYNLIWFCYSKKDYDILPAWLKESEDVIFVSAYVDKDGLDEIKDEKEESQLFLPAEDVFSALISKFSIDAPYIFSNPIKYYIEVVDSFLPENIDVFPIEVWKRRLDYIEGKFTELEKKMIALDDASARKDMQKVTDILSNINMSYVSDEDVTHIINGIVKPIISNRNSIEEREVIIAFIKRVIDIVSEKRVLFSNDIISDYIILILQCAFKHGRVIGVTEELSIIDSLLNLCKVIGEVEPLLFTKLVKSNFVDEDEKRIILNEIIYDGKENIQSLNACSAVISAINILIELQEPIDDDKLQLLDNIKEEHSDNKDIQDDYYYLQLHMCEKDFYKPTINIKKVVDEIQSIDASPQLLLHARVIECNLEDDKNKKIIISEKAINDYDIENIDTCAECQDYANVIYQTIINKILISQQIEMKYIDQAFLLCEKEHHCEFVLKKMIYTIYKYIGTIESSYEKKAHLKRMILLCSDNEIFEEYALCVIELFKIFDENEKERFIQEYPMSEQCYRAHQYNVKAIDEYINHNIEDCGKLLLEASKIYDDIFKQQYNPALINICYMVRRDELSDYNMNELDIVRKITWMDSDAFFHINEALIYLKYNDWEKAINAVKNIETDLDSALDWWGNENIVGLYEKNQVYVLLLISGKIDINLVEDKEVFDEFCRDSISIPPQYYETIMSSNSQTHSNSENGCSA